MNVKKNVKNAELGTALCDLTRKKESRVNRLGFFRVFFLQKNSLKGDDSLVKAK